jgi:hypothetical protein
LRATKIELGSVSRNYNLVAYPDARSLFRYEMHTLPSEISDAISTAAREFARRMTRDDNRGTSKDFASACGGK